MEMDVTLPTLTQWVHRRMLLMGEELERLARKRKQAVGAAVSGTLNLKPRNLNFPDNPDWVADMHRTSLLEAYRILPDPIWREFRRFDYQEFVTGMRDWIALWLADKPIDWSMRSVVLGMDRASHSVALELGVSMMETSEGKRWVSQKSTNPDEHDVNLAWLYQTASRIKEEISPLIVEIYRSLVVPALVIGSFQWAMHMEKEMILSLNAAGIQVGARIGMHHFLVLDPIAPVW